MEFIKDLHEARMTRDASNQRVLTYTDCCERLYLSLLIVELLRKFSKYKSIAQNYARRTTRYTGYDHFQPSGTDLYNFVYFVNGDKQAINKLKDPGSAWEVRKNTTLPVMRLNGYLTKVSSGADPSSSLNIFLAIESALRITNTNYKEIRRNILNISSISSEVRKKNITALIYAARAKLRSSDIIDDLEKLAVDGNFETGSVIDTEPTISLPDISTSNADMVNYRFLVGTKNIMLAKRAVDLATKGASIPGNMILAYVPIMKMVHDIVRAGPSFIQQLRVLHKRAQKSAKE